MKILLISGHGAGQPGACANGYREVDLTRELVNLIAPRLREYATVDVYNQSHNAFIDIEKGIFNVRGYDYVLEVHFNSFNGKAYGTEIYVTNAEKGTSVEQAIMNELSSFFKVRGVKRKDFLVIKTCKRQGVSAALLETCFIDNTSDIQKYQANKHTIADSIVKGIAVGFGLVEGKVPSQPQKPSKKSVAEIAQEVIDGTWGNGSDRKQRLTNAGYNPIEVQAKVNELLGAPSRKSIEIIAREVIQGKWGNGQERKKRLAQAGYDPKEVQRKVNELL